MESYFLKIITGEKKGIFASWLRFFLYVLSWPFQCAVACRNWAFDKGILCRYYPPVPVVMSIGNIVAGGTGKTPATLMIANEFYQEFVLAVLARGYRSSAEKLSSPIMLSRGNGPMQPASFCGDESFLLSQNLPKAFVIVGRNRHQASDMAAKAGAQLILLDDGMQHRRLARDFEVVVMDAADLFGQGYFLPRGLLREGAKSLSRAHLIILNHAADPQVFASMKAQVERYSQAVVVGTSMEVIDVIEMSGKSCVDLKGKKVGIFCGIARPQYFANTVCQLGGSIVSELFLPDHIGLERSALNAFAEKCREKGAELIVCTEKDRVKLVDTLGVALPIAWVKMRLKVVHGELEWRAFMDKVRSDLKSRI